LEKSLQAMKNGIAKKEETLKALQKTYPHLSHLPDAQILAYFDVDTIPELKKHIKESTQPHDNLTEQDIDICSCTDSKGQPKDLYNSEESAQREANALATQKRLQLKVYPCPDGYGWHLSKR
jgi:hypothetical protein